MLTYEDAEPIQVYVPKVVMEPSPRRGLIGRIKDRVLGPELKPHVVLNKDMEDRIKKHWANIQAHTSEVNDSAVTAEDIKEATDRFITLARGHHIRNADGTVTDVSDNPKYKCNKNK